MTTGQQTERQTSSWPQLSAEWNNHKIEPSFPECPLVVDVDVAEQVVRAALEDGMIDEDSAKRRLTTLNLRRLVIAGAQDAHGCRGECSPAGPNDSTEQIPKPAPAPGQLPADLTCNLPVGRIEANAYGNGMSDPQNHAVIETNRIGY
jgi:hypothetical protein